MKVGLLVTLGEERLQVAPILRQALQSRSSGARWRIHAPTLATQASMPEFIERNLQRLPVGVTCILPALAERNLQCPPVGVESNHKNPRKTIPRVILLTRVFGLL